MKISSLFCSLILLASTPNINAQEQDITPGRQLSEIIYGSIEENPNGRVDMGEFVDFGQDIFASMDFDDDGSIEFAEFKQWDFGFNFIAKDEGQQHAYQAAQKILFAVWDRDGDGKIKRREYHKAMIWDFTRADVDDNALLSREEFLKGYIVIVAYRAAITGL